MTSVSRSGLRCRQIVDADIDNLADLLAHGFPAKPRRHWSRALARLARHPTPGGSPKYGYVLEDSTALQGAVLLLTSAIRSENTSITRCNVSSWYVSPKARMLATLLALRAVSRPEVTYINVSPARHTFEIIEAQGFSRYSNGQFVAFPRFKSPSENARVFDVKDGPEPPFDSFERELLLAHANYGCLSLWCSAADGAYPFVFLPRSARAGIPCFQLVYCRQIEDYVRFARILEWRFISHRRPFVIVDANKPILGLSGKYFDGVAPKYFKGSNRPRLGDLAYTELPMFGM